MLCWLASQASQSITCTEQIGAQGDERHLLLESLAMQPTLEEFVQMSSEGDALKMSKWQEDTFMVARYICACMIKYTSDA